MSVVKETREEAKRQARANRCEDEHLYFTRYFFKQRHGIKFIVNWHHAYISDEIDKVISGETENVIFNFAPGGSKTEVVVINLIARGLAKNPWSRFLHLSYSDELATLNSSAAREIVRSDEYQELWPLEISSDSKSKKRWNVMVGDRRAGGVYATSLSGQVTGFRAGHMTEGFQGAIIIDDPMKPEDAFSKTKVDAANRQLVTTVKSRKANPRTPIIIVMQRVGEIDTTGFIEAGGLPGKWKVIRIPALLSEEALKNIPSKYHDMMDRGQQDENGRFSYWEYKEPVADLVEMEQGKGKDGSGNLISRFVFTCQYQQSPTRMGGNIIRGSYFKRWKVLPRLKWRKIYADTAQKTKEANDYSVFIVVGEGKEDGKLYLVDLIRGKWEAPELYRQAVDFWNKHKDQEKWNTDVYGSLRKMLVEDKSSGTGLVQSIKAKGRVPVTGIERDKDKYTRVMDALPYLENGEYVIPEEAPWVSDYISEHEAFTANGTHAHDDQVDPTMDAINDNLSTNNRLKTWEKLAQ